MTRSVAVCSIFEFNTTADNSRTTWPKQWSLVSQGLMQLLHWQLGTNGLLSFTTRVLARHFNTPNTCHSGSLPPAEHIICELIYMKTSVVDKWSLQQKLLPTEQCYHRNILSQYDRPIGFESDKAVIVVWSLFKTSNLAEFLGRTSNQGKRYSEYKEPAPTQFEKCYS